MSSSSTIILSAENVQNILEFHGLNEFMDNLIDRMTNAMKQHNPNETKIPIRDGFSYQLPQPGLIEWMPLMDEKNQIVVKVVGYHPNNPTQFELPTILSTISKYDTKTGHLTAVVDGVLLTALRTGAASAVASKTLALPEAETLGLIGCGAQAITQLHGLSRLFKFKKILAFDIDPVTLNSFSERCRHLDLKIPILPLPIKDIVNNSDILCTATSIDVGAGPLFSALETKSHLHVNAVGSDFPGKVELPSGLLKISYICPDFREQAVIEGESQQLNEDQIGHDLYKIIQEDEHNSELKYDRSVFDSTGWALEDQVVMDLFLELAEDMQIGQKIEIESTSSDAKNPYHFIQALVGQN